MHYVPPCVRKGREGIPIIPPMERLEMRPFSFEQISTYPRCTGLPLIVQEQDRAPATKLCAASRMRRRIACLLEGVVVHKSLGLLTRS